MFKEVQSYFYEEIRAQVYLKVIIIALEKNENQDNELTPPLTEGMALPRRKSKFLKMLKTYTKHKYGRSPDEPKSPAIEALEQAKKDLKKLTGKVTFINYLVDNKIQSSFVQNFREQIKKNNKK